MDATSCPPDCRDAADAILVVAAKAGARTCRIWPSWPRRSTPGPCPSDPDHDRDEAFEDRSVRLETTFDGAGVLSGDLTPGVRGGGDGGAGRAVGAGGRGGHPDPEPSATTTHCRRRCAGWSTAGLLPERAGQPVKVWVHISLADLHRPGRQLGAAGGVDRRVRAQWAAHRAAASAGGSDGAAWLDGDAAEAMACDAVMAPIVTGEVNPAAG